MSRFTERLEAENWQRSEYLKKFDEHERRKERAADPLEEIIADEAEDDMEYGRR